MNPQPVSEAWLTAEPWTRDALCAQIDPETWFPRKGHPAASRAARAICHACPVEAECLEYALRHDERFGIWGGQTEAQRRKLKRAAQ